MRYAMFRRSSALQSVEVELRDLRPVQELEREHARRRVLPDDARDDHPRIAREVAVEGVGVPRLVAVVELEPDRARELVDELPRVHELERAHALAEQLRRLVEQPEIRLDLAGGRRPLDLDGHDLAVGQDGAVHLADRGRRDRNLVELEERLLDGEPELLLDHLAHLLERERRDVVLELPQLDDDVRRDDVRPRREELPELHEGRAELVEHLAEPPPAVGAASPSPSPFSRPDMRSPRRLRRRK